jgi:acetyl-CoA synthetase
VFWTPADWAWIGGLMDALVPSLYLGRPVVAGPRGRFDPELAARVIVETGVRNVFVPPTALRLMNGAGISLPGGTLRTLMSGGESLGGDTLAWARERLGVTVAEIYGRPRRTTWSGTRRTCGRCAPARWVCRTGTRRRRDRRGGQRAPSGRGRRDRRPRPDPVAFLEYLNAPAATAAKFVGPWLRTGDLASRDADGYLWFTSRADDIIISAGLPHLPARGRAMPARTSGGRRGRGRRRPRRAARPGREGVRDRTRRGSDTAARGRAEAARPHALAAYEYPRELVFVRELRSP